MSPSRTPALPEGYADWLTKLKGDIVQARQRAALAVNAELVQLYHRLGSEIQQRQEAHGWGAKVVERLARDLKDAFPDMKGWSASNLKYMRFFAQHCPDRQFGQQPADQLPWFHVVTLLTKLDSPSEREWYAQQTVLHGWSRSTLELNIKSRLVAEYALSGIGKPIGVAEYQLLRDLPETLGCNLPSIAEIEAELAGELDTGSELE